MKILIQHKTTPHTGKGQFVDRLMPVLKSLGHKVTGNIIETADIALHIGRVHYKSKARKNILRVGPACIDTSMKWKAINNAKWNSVKVCDGVIYQSEYSRKIYHTLVGKTDSPEAIIFNGADPKYYYKFSSLKSPYKYNILCSTRKWIPQKRLKCIIKAFKEMNRKDVRLWIAGDYSMTKWAKQTLFPGNIKFLGLCGQEQLARLYNLCNAMIHLTYIDACPNSVVEALVAGCPVICTSEGGTRELIKDVGIMKSYSGIVLEDEKFVFKPIDLRKPPKVNISKLAEAMSKYCEDNDDAPPYIEHIKIENIAKQYVEFFEKCLN